MDSKDLSKKYSIGATFNQSQQEAQDSCNRIMQEDEIINEKISFFEK